MYVIELQKRCLPHVHVLVIFADGYKLLSPMVYDHVICAEIPDRNADPELYDIAAKCYMHEPCGDKNLSCACMKNARCSNGYPKEFVDATMDNQDGYPVYGRRNNGCSVLCRGHVLDIQWVVPHVHALARRYNCHINVEYCASIAAIKYLHEYIPKGFDRGAAVMRHNLYICTSEGVWRLLGFGMHEQFPPVMRLPEKRVGTAEKGMGRTHGLHTRVKAPQQQRQQTEKYRQGRQSERIGGEEARNGVKRGEDQESFDFTTSTKPSQATANRS